MRGLRLHSIGALRYSGHTSKTVRRRWRNDYHWVKEGIASKVRLQNSDLLSPFRQSCQRKKEKERRKPRENNFSTDETRGRNSSLEYMTFLGASVNSSVLATRVTKIEISNLISDSNWEKVPWFFTDAYN